MKSAVMLTPALRQSSRILDMSITCTPSISVSSVDDEGRQGVQDVAMHRGAQSVREAVQIAGGAGRVSPRQIARVLDAAVFADQEMQVLHVVLRPVLLR